MTHNIEPNQKMDADTVQITVPAEKDLPDKIEKQNDLIIAPKEEKDAIGSGQLTAPVPSLSVGKAR